jgi:glutamate-1-semialdehyde aminotransferase
LTSVTPSGPGSDVVRGCQQDRAGRGGQQRADGEVRLEAEHPIRNWRDAERYANEPRFTCWFQEMFLRGVLFHPSQYENLFVSLVTTDEDIDATLAAADDSFKVLAAEAS